MIGSRSPASFDDFGSALKYWRVKRGYSQAQLSALAGVSQRHMSFVECGRARASKDLIDKLNLALDLPLRQCNLMLLASGFPPAYQESNLSDPRLRDVRQAIDFMLKRQHPYPAIVIDRVWNLQLLNKPASAVIQWFLGLPAERAIPLDGSVNMIKLLIDHQGGDSTVGNWQETAKNLMYWLKREAMSDGPESEASRLLAEIGNACSFDNKDEAGKPDLSLKPVLPLTLSREGVTLSMFPMIATLATPKDVTLHEMKIETFFPANKYTAEWFQERYCEEDLSFSRVETQSILKYASHFIPQSR